MKNGINKNGFTLIELLVAMSIMGILLVMTIPRISNMRREYEVKKYETYAKSVERAAKLYTESHSKEMFGHQDSGCYTVKYNDLKSSNLIKKYVDDGGYCSVEDSNTFVTVRKIGDQYEYNTAIKCYNKSRKEMLNWSVNKDECKIDPDTDGPTLEIVFNGADSTHWVNLNETTVSVKIKLHDKSGFWANQTVKYHWHNNSTNEDYPTRVLEFGNKRAIKPEDLIKNIPNKYIPRDSGELKLIVEPDTSNDRTGIKDYLGNSTNASETKILKVDLTAPSVPTSQVKSYGDTGNTFTIGENIWSKVTLWWGNFSATDGQSGIDHYEYSEGCTGAKSDNLASYYLYDHNKNTYYCIRAVDKVGNIGDWSSPYYFNVDLNDPNVPTSTVNIDGHWLGPNGVPANPNQKTPITSLSKDSYSCSDYWWGDFTATDNGPSGIDHYEYLENCDTNNIPRELSPSYHYATVTSRKYCIRSVDKAGRPSQWSQPYKFKVCKCKMGQCDTGDTTTTNCTTTTTYSDWSKCSQNCGSKGVQTRTVTTRSSCENRSYSTTESRACNRKDCFSVTTSNYHICPSDQNRPSASTCSSRWYQYDSFEVNVTSVNRAKVNIKATIGMNNTSVTVDGMCSGRRICIAKSNSDSCIEEIGTFNVGSSSWLARGAEKTFSKTVTVRDYDKGNYRVVVESTGCSSTKFRFLTLNKTTAFNVNY
ncbi:MAG: prepilin-type N-terminal cleavage/methylation domain-containing protein [Firmicutes bacterium]|nr:prepilin-type N-terminal cleavage/methylation domain-containing protein [Bacillota bacterium]